MSTSRCSMLVATLFFVLQASAVRPDIRSENFLDAPDSTSLLETADKYGGEGVDKNTPGPSCYEKATCEACMELHFCVWAKISGTCNLESDPLEEGDMACRNCLTLEDEEAKLSDKDCDTTNCDNEFPVEVTNAEILGGADHPDEIIHPETEGYEENPDENECAEDDAECLAEQAEIDAAEKQDAETVDDMNGDGEVGPDVNGDGEEDVLVTPSLVDGEGDEIPPEDPVGAVTLIEEMATARSKTDQMMEKVMSEMHEMEERMVSLENSLNEEKERTQALQENELRMEKERHKSKYHLSSSTSSFLEESAQYAPVQKETKTVNAKDFFSALESASSVDAVIKKTPNPMMRHMEQEVIKARLNHEFMEPSYLKDERREKPLKPQRASSRTAAELDPEAYYQPEYSR